MTDIKNKVDDMIRSKKFLLSYTDTLVPIGQDGIFANTEDFMRQIVNVLLLLIKFRKNYSFKEKSTNKLATDVKMIMDNIETIINESELPYNDIRGMLKYILS